MSVVKQKILFTKEECDLILKKYINKPVDGNQVEKNNISYTYRIVNDIEERWILERLILWIREELNVDVEWDISDHKEFYLHTYVKGDKFDRHNDNTHDRVYGLGLLLNDEFEGGRFVVDTNNPRDETFNFEKIVGNCYIFGSAYEHQLYEIKEGVRNVILLFIKKSQLKYDKTKLI